MSNREHKAWQNDNALGGMRRPDKSVAQLPGYNAGEALFDMFDEFIDRRPDALAVVSALRNGEDVQGFAPALLREFRARWMSLLGNTEPRHGNGPDADAIEAWGRFCNDPDTRRGLPIRCILNSRGGAITAQQMTNLRWCRDC